MLEWRVWVVVGCLMARGVAPAQSTAAAEGEPEAVWPAEWVAFGPVPPLRDMARAGVPHPTDLLPAESLAAIPAELVIEGQSYPGRTVRLDACRLDLDFGLPGVPRGSTMYLMAPLRAAQDTRLPIGAGADWWMSWWLDGRPVFDTLLTGNMKGPVTLTNHLFEVPVSRGEHVLAVAVIRGKGSFLFAAGGPRDLKNPPKPKAMSEYDRAMAAGKQARLKDTVRACAEFRRALDLAATDAGRAEALLALGSALLADYDARDYAAVQSEYERALALPGLTAAQQAEAWLGITEARLMACHYEPAREACDKAQAACDEAGPTSRAQMLRARTYLQARDWPAAKREFGRLLDMPHLHPQLRWEAESLRSVIPVLERLRKDRPRLFFNADTWPAVRERALTVERDLYDQMKARLEDLSLEDVQSGNWASPDRGTGRIGVMEAAFVYRVTGDPLALEKVRRMLRASVEAEWGQSYSASTYIMWATALDWVWNDLVPPERAALADALLRFASRWMTESRFNNELAGWPHYYTGSLCALAGIALLDSESDDVTYARALSLIGIGFSQYRNRFASLIERSGDDGVWQTNIEYDLNTVPTAVWSFLYAWQPAMGVPLPAEWSGVGISPHVALRMVVDLVKGHYRHMNYAGHSNGAWGYGEQTSNYLYDNLGHFVHLFARTDPEQAAIAQYFRRWMVEAGAGPGDGPYPLFRFLMTDLEKAPPPELPKGLPTARFFNSVGLVLMSSGFGPNETYALFSQGGGVSGSRHDFDATHFSIYKGGFLALDTGVRFALPHSPNYRHQTVAHNAVLIRMPGEQFRPCEAPVESNAGGQNLPPQDSKPLAFETSRLYAYTAMDAAPVYHTNKCAQMTRQFVYLPPNHFVVFDRVTATQADYPKTWLLHTANEPTITGREFRADQGEGRLFCRTLLPADAVLEPVGGPGKEFWADGRNWPIVHVSNASDAADWWKRYGRGNTEPPEAMGRWRIEVKPGAAREADFFLHLIQVGSRSVEAMSKSALREAGDHAELAFEADGRAYAIRFHKTGAVGGHIRIEEGGKTAVDSDLATDIQPQAGLALEP